MIDEDKTLWKFINEDIENESLEPERNGLFYFIDTYLEVKQNFTGTKSVIVMNDISRMIHLEKETQKNLKLYFTNSAHEFRSPLNSVMPVV